LAAGASLHRVHLVIWVNESWRWVFPIISKTEESMAKECEQVCPVRGGVTVRGRLARVACLRDEWYEEVEDPNQLIQYLRRRRPRVDIFTFIQRLPDTKPRYDYPMEWDNFAVIPIRTFDDWWKNQISKSTRKHIRRSEKLGVEVRVVPFDETLMKGIAEIYDESPIRGGRPFMHYKADFQKLTAAHETFLEQSQFVGAFLGQELIGFVKMVFIGPTARTMQIISKIKHRDKYPTNALIAKAVQICAERGVPQLVYGRLEYGKAGSQGLSDFKQENGFEQVLVPRYYIPLNPWGRLSLQVGLQRGFIHILPRFVVRTLRYARAKWYEKRYPNPAQALGD
jgi:hypothetical protein